MPWPDTANDYYIQHIIIYSPPDIHAPALVPRMYDSPLSLQAAVASPPLSVQGAFAVFDTIPPTPPSDPNRY